ncbi:Blp family class II bacteriocin [Lactobacillus intestinalis]|uniref:Blp family class II bacteriocin n=1 Tax=Lactobacillus intestinalis TaxID=151781 RepID=UPI0025A9A30C|nr:Blp family class II bacteriocin [Lactobacillus intestinalis]
MENKFVTLTEEELALVYGGKSCGNNFLGGLAAGVPGGIIGGANLGMVGGAISCLRSL